MGQRIRIIPILFYLPITKIKNKENIGGYLTVIYATPEMLPLLVNVVPEPYSVM